MNPGRATAHTPPETRPFLRRSLYRRDTRQVLLANRFRRRSLLSWDGVPREISQEEDEDPGFWDQNRSKLKADQRSAMDPVVVVVEDEEHLREAVVEYLGDQGIPVLAAADGQALRDLAQTERLDVVILDIAMPGEDGLSLARWLRQMPGRPGIIFATSAGTSVDRVVGLEIGADDYLVKPYDLRELLARVRTLLRRIAAEPPPIASSKPPTPPPAAHRAGSASHTLNFDSRRLYDPRVIRSSSTATEFDLLAMLVAPTGPHPHPRTAAGRRARPQCRGGDRSIDIRVTRLRKKIETNPQAAESDPHRSGRRVHVRAGERLMVPTSIAMQRRAAVAVAALAVSFCVGALFLRHAHLLRWNLLIGDPGRSLVGLLRGIDLVAGHVACPLRRAHSAFSVPSSISRRMPWSSATIEGHVVGANPAAERIFGREGTAIERPTVRISSRRPRHPTPT